MDLDSFVPDMIEAPGGTTHFKIISADAEIDFEAETFIEAHSETDIFPCNQTSTVAISHVNTVTASSTIPLFLAVADGIASVVSQLTTGEEILPDCEDDSG